MVDFALTSVVRFIGVSRYTCFTLGLHYLFVCQLVDSLGIWPLRIL